MLNLEDFIKRLELIMDFYGLSGSSFADKIGIQRSSLSHLLSGRNKPSLDFVMKIVTELPEVDFNWILNGFGEFPKSNQKQSTAILPKSPIPSTPLLFPDDIQQDIFIDDVREPEFEAPIATIQPVIEQEKVQNTTKIIENIVIFYTDGTFSDYTKLQRG